MDLAGQSLVLVIGLFVGGAVVVGAAGISLTGLADRIADRTGMGEAVTGAVFLGGTTSLSGIVTSVTAAWEGHPALAISNAVGGIAIQTAFLAIADFVNRDVNLEHASASVANMTQCALLVGLLSLPLLATSAPSGTVLGVHPASLVIVVAYAGGIFLISKDTTEPMWRPRLTSQTQRPQPSEQGPARGSLAMLWGGFAALAVVVGVAGYVIAQSGAEIAGRTPLSESAVGALFTGPATSLPELVTALAAVRRGALELAVGGIMGGNSFDVMLLSFADFAYRPASLYDAFRDRDVFLVALPMLMSAVLLLGLLRRERRGFAGIGFESLLLLLIYGAGVVLLLIGQ